MYVPSDFTVQAGTTVRIENCEIIKHELWNMDSCNVFQSTFKGDVVLDGWLIYTEDHPAVFLDKLESYTTQEERLV